MQTPCKTSDGTMARELFLWIPTLLVMAGLWLGCGQQVDSAPAAPAADTGGDAPAAPSEAEPGNTETIANPEAEPEHTELIADPADKPAAGARSLASHLPKKTTMVFSANLKQLLDKGGYKDLLESDLFEQLMNEVDDELAIAILKDPAASGLNIARPAHVFMNVQPPAEEFGEPTVTGGLVMAVKDAATLEKTLNKIIAATGMPFRVTDANGYKQVAMQGMPVALGFTDKVFVVVGTSDETKVGRVPAMLKARMTGKPKPNASLSVHLKKKYDVAAWFDYAQLMEMIGEVVGEEDPAAVLMMNLYKDLTYSSTVSFDAGAVTVDFSGSFGKKENEKFANMAGKGADASLLNMVPDDSILAFAESVNMKAVRKMFNEDILPLLEDNDEFGEVLELIEENLGLSLKELLSIPKGDMVLSWDSLEMAEGDFGPQPKVGFVFGFTVENWVAANKLINNPELQQGMTMLKAMAGIQFAQNQKALFITTDKHAAAVAEGTTVNPIKGARHNLLGKHVAGGFIRFDRVADVVEIMAEGDEEADKIVEVLRVFDEASFTSNMLSMKGKLTFKDKKTNGLKQLVDLSVELAEMAGEFGIGNEAEPEVVVEAEVLGPVAEEAIPREK
jgi:hypothetical protein